MSRRPGLPGSRRAADSWSRHVPAGLRTDEPSDRGREALTGVLKTERAAAWTGVIIAGDMPFYDLELWLLALPEFCVLTARQAAIDQGLVIPSGLSGTPALASGGTLAYLTRRPTDAADKEETAFEFGAYAHGPRGAELAERLAGQLRVWDRHHRHGTGPVLTVYPAGATPTRDLPAGYVVSKRHNHRSALLARYNPVITTAKEEETRNGLGGTSSCVSGGCLG
jgi:protein-L-isoaspartate(D-aspartate) O-methyltransferase